MRGPVLLLSICSVLLAGCGGPADPGDGVPDDVQPADVLLLPTWTVGDWWTYEIPLGTATWVVTGEDGGDWIVSTDNPDLAFEHAAQAPISTLGAVSKDALDGSQGADRVHFFDWPLEHGKTWSMTWDQETFQAEAHVSAEDGLAHIVYSQDDVTRRNVVYDADIGWFRSIEGMDADGEVVWTMKLRSSGHGYRGDTVAWLIGDRVQMEITPGVILNEESFEVAQEATDIWYFLHAFCDPGGIEGDQGTYTIRVGPRATPLTPVFDALERCPESLLEIGTWPTEGGTWYVDVSSTGGTVLVDIIPRTLVTQTR